MKAPALSPILLIADDAKLAAELSCAFSRQGAYLAVVDGPRMGRPDHQAEVIRRYNAALRVKATQIVFAGMSEISTKALRRLFRSKQIIDVRSSQDVTRIATRKDSSTAEPFIWGSDRIGIGLLNALRARRPIKFEEDHKPAVKSVSSRSGHLVVCEDGDDLVQVIAANYAYSLEAGLHVIPAIPPSQAKALLERLYSLYDADEISPTQALEEVVAQLRLICGPLPIPTGGSATFITAGVPFGLAITDVPSTHLFKYPDLGIAVINGLAAEQRGAGSIDIAVLVDPGLTVAREIEAAEQKLVPRGTYVRTYSGEKADVRSVSQMVELFPYDLLIIATHCGDISGSRWTYEFSDSEGIERQFVIDVAVGIGRTNDDDLLSVTELDRFVSLDGIDWNDPEKANKLYVGNAINDFVQRTKQGGDLEPVEKKAINRVHGSAALKMADHYYLAIPRSLANERTPIVINNACSSWHQLGKTFTFGNARAYVGTLFPVSDAEAYEVAVKFLDKAFSRPLPVALWLAQRSTYGEGSRRPYVVTGVFPQRLHVQRTHVPRLIVKELEQGLRHWKTRLQNVDVSDTRLLRDVTERVEFYEGELNLMRRKWFPEPKPKEPR